MKKTTITCNRRTLGAEALVRKLSIIQLTIKLDARAISPVWSLSRAANSCSISPAGSGIDCSVVGYGNRESSRLPIQLQVLITETREKRGKERVQASYQSACSTPVYKFGIVGLSCSWSSS